MYAQTIPGLTLLAAAASIGIKYWLSIHAGILAKCVVGIVAFVACLLPEDAARGVLERRTNSTRRGRKTNVK
jgi:hypothetical protein